MTVVSQGLGGLTLVSQGYTAGAPAPTPPAVVPPAGQAGPPPPVLLLADEVDSDLASAVQAVWMTSTATAGADVDADTLASIAALWLRS